MVIIFTEQWCIPNRKIPFNVIYYTSILNSTFQLDYWNLYCTLKILKYSAGQFNILPPVLNLSGSCVIHSSHLTEAAIMEITYFFLTPPVKSHVLGQYREFWTPRLLGRDCGSPMHAGYSLDSKKCWIFHTTIGSWGDGWGLFPHIYR